MNRIVIALILLITTACATTLTEERLDPLRDSSIQRKLEGQYVFIYKHSEYTPPEFIQELTRHFGGITGIQPAEYQQKMLAEKEKFKAVEPTVILDWSMIYDSNGRLYNGTDEISIEMELLIFPISGGKFTKKSSCHASQNPTEHFREFHMRVFTTCFLQLLRPWWRQ